MWRPILLTAGLLSSLGCPTTSELARPNTPTAKEGLEEPEEDCDPEALPEESTPLVVHWSEGQRARLEAAMKKGIAVVKYGCDGVEVLPACTAAGSYAYSGVSPKTRLVTMADQASVAANFGTGLQFLQGIEAKIGAGRSLDLAYLLVGLEATTVPRVSEAELRGRCEGATHFVYDVSLGAFAMDTSAAGEAKAAATILGRGGEISGGSSKSVGQRDGDPAACERASEEDERPTSGCRAPLRVSLFAIDADAEKKTEPAGRRDARGCPEGFVYSEDQCLREERAKSHLCAGDDLDDCIAECQAGSAGSCGRAARLGNAVLTDPDAGRDAKQSMLDRIEGMERALRAACEEGEGPACTAVAYARFRKLTGADKAKNQAEGLAYAEKGCLWGEPQACRMMRRAYVTDAGQLVGVKLDPARFVAVLQRGCARGSALPCQLVAELQALGQHVPVDLEAARRHADRACEGGRTSACLLAGALRAEPERCEPAMARYLALADEDADSKARARLPAVCEQVTPEPRESGAWFSRACKAGETQACAWLR